MSQQSDNVLDSYWKFVRQKTRTEKQISSSGLCKVLLLSTYYPSLNIINPSALSGTFPIYQSPSGSLSLEVDDLFLWRSTTSFSGGRRSWFCTPAFKLIETLILLSSDANVVYSINYISIAYTETYFLIKYTEIAWRCQESSLYLRVHDRLHMYPLVWDPLCPLA